MTRSSYQFSSIQIPCTGITVKKLIPIYSYMCFLQTKKWSKITCGMKTPHAGFWECFLFGVCLFIFKLHILNDLQNLHNDVFSEPGMLKELECRASIFISSLNTTKMPVFATSLSPSWCFICFKFMKLCFVQNRYYKSRIYHSFKRELGITILCCSDSSHHIPTQNSFTACSRSEYF